MSKLSDMTASTHGHSVGNLLLGSNADDQMVLVGHPHLLETHAR